MGPDKRAEPRTDFTSFILFLKKQKNKTKNCDTEKSLLNEVTILNASSLNLFCQEAALMHGSVIQCIEINIFF